MSNPVFILKLRSVCRFPLHGWIRQYPTLSFCDGTCRILYIFCKRKSNHGICQRRNTARSFRRMYSYAQEILLQKFSYGILYIPLLLWNNHFYYRSWCRRCRCFRSNSCICRLQELLLKQRRPWPKPKQTGLAVKSFLFSSFPPPVKTMCRKTAIIKSRPCRTAYT